MNIAVIAADGRLGRAFVSVAKARGHNIRAGIRGNASVPQYVQCDATNLEQVKQLIQGCDVVVSCLGHVKGSAADVQTVATRVIIEAMYALGITRFVDLTGTGARVPDDQVTLIDRFLNFGVSLVDPNRVKDGINHLRVLEGSDLEWTTVRVLKLQNTPPRPYELLEHGPTKIYVGRHEAAQAMMEVIEQHKFIRQAPIIGKKR